MAYLRALQSSHADLVRIVRLVRTFFQKLFYSGRRGRHGNAIQEKVEDRKCSR